MHEAVLNTAEYAQAHMHEACQNTAGHAQAHMREAFLNTAGYARAYRQRCKHGMFRINNQTLCEDPCLVLSNALPLLLVLLVAGARLTHSRQ